MGGATLGPSPAQLSTAERVFTTRASLLNAYAGTLVRICVSVSVAVAVSIRYLRRQRVYEWKWKQ